MAGCGACYCWHCAAERTSHSPVRQRRYERQTNNGRPALLILRSAAYLTRVSAATKAIGGHARLDLGVLASQNSLDTLECFAAEQRYTFACYLDGACFKD